MLQKQPIEIAITTENREAGLALIHELVAAARRAKMEMRAIEPLARELQSADARWAQEQKPAAARQRELDAALAPLAGTHILSFELNVSHSGVSPTTVVVGLSGDAAGLARFYVRYTDAAGTRQVTEVRAHVLKVRSLGANLARTVPQVIVMGASSLDFPEECGVSRDRCERLLAAFHDAYVSAGGTIARR